MCLTCSKHVAENLWYMDPENHRVRSMGPIRNTINQYFHETSLLGVKSLMKKQPYGVDDQFTGVSKRLYNWLGKSWQGTQVLPDMDSAFKLVDLANEIALVPCICVEIFAPELHPVWRCLTFNIVAGVYIQKNPCPVKVLGKQEAKDLIAKWRGEGAIQTVGWLWDAHVAMMCNCDVHCSSRRAAELEWGRIPSFVIANLVKPDACDGCQECANWCLRPGALTFGQDGRVVVDKVLCEGCGLCIEHCPTGALAYAAREVFYDVSTGVIRPLGKDAIRF